MEIDHKVFYRVAGAVTLVLMIMIGYLFTQTTYGKRFCELHGTLGQRYITNSVIYNKCSVAKIPFSPLVVGIEAPDHQAK